MKENLSQRKLLEVLTHEIEVLRNTSKNINEAAPTIARLLQEIKQTKLIAKVDLSEFKSIISNHQSYVQSKIAIPKWFLIAFLILVGILTIQSVWIYGYFFGS